MSVTHKSDSVCLFLVVCTLLNVLILRKYILFHGANMYRDVVNEVGTVLVNQKLNIIAKNSNNKINIIAIVEAHRDSKILLDHYFHDELLNKK